MTYSCKERSKHLLQSNTILEMQEVSDLIDLLVSGEKSDDMYVAIDYAFQGQTKAETYFLDNDGNAYCANSQ